MDSLLAVLDIGNQVVGHVESLKVLQAFQTFKLANVVVGQVKSVQPRQMRYVLDHLNLILVKKSAKFNVLDELHPRPATYSEQSSVTGSKPLILAMPLLSSQIDLTP